MQLAQNNPSSAIFGIYRLLIIFSVLFTLYFAQTIVIPIAIAALLAFLVSPLVTFLERWLGRVLSILITVVLVFSILGVAITIFTRQLISFGANFPGYYEIIKKKLGAFHFPSGSLLDRIADALESLKSRLFGDIGTVEDITPMESKLIEFGTSLTRFIESFFGSFFNAVAMTGMVIILVIVILLNREDIRSRVIKLIGQGRISSATSAMHEASIRVFRYLFRQFIVNITFGTIVFLGLHLIGIPNAILWGSLAAVLRFIPYIGAPVAATIPIVLSFIISDTWTIPILTVGFFVTLEIITAYFVEPVYFGVGTGISSFALIFAAIFWTWLWGPIGLLLSTPLTVCLAVIGHYVPNMDFLRVIVSQEEALTPAEECYQRLLSYDTNAAIDVVENYLKKNSIVSLYDSVVIPTITQTEIDLHMENINMAKKEEVYQGISEIIDFLSLQEQKETVPQSPVPIKKIFCFPARTLRDELGANILSQELARELFEVHYTTTVKESDILTLINERNPDVICIVAVAPIVLSHVRFLSVKLHQRRPKTPILVCLWGERAGGVENLEKLTAGGASKIATTLQDAVKFLTEMRVSES